MPAYEDVLFNGQTRGGCLSGDGPATIAARLQAAIERKIVDGWEFHSLARTNIEVKAGCLGAPLRGGVSYTGHDQLVFT